MRLNWFLPYRRKSSGSEKGRPGPIRVVLGRMGTTWLCSPLRRLVQAVCLAGFVGLFCYVCWPYTARPARVWSDWLPAEVDAETGRVLVVSERSPVDYIRPDMVLYVVDSGAPEDSGATAFRVAKVGPRELALEPAEELTPEQLDTLAVSVGRWSLHEKDPGDWPSHYADELEAKQSKVAAEIFLTIDPLSSISTALAARSEIRSLGFADTTLWWSLSCAGVLLLICTVVPRGFCGYVCPLGTLIDLFDWAVGRRVGLLRVGAGGWWVHVKYYLLLACLIGSLLGVLLSGFVSAIRSTPTHWSVP